MDGNFRTYNWHESADRIKEILDQPAGQFVEAKELPDRDSLTFTNGFYASCSAVFVDIRDSSGLTSKYQRPKLAKLYRSFISEMVAVLNSHPKVREVNIVGDCVWAVYNTPLTSDIDEVFSVFSRANSLRAMLNKLIVAREYDPIACGIGVDYGRALMIKAGYKGSGINEVVYMGDVVNRAAHLAHEAGRGYEPPVFMGSAFYGNLKDHNKSLTSTRYHYGIGANIYVCNPVPIAMNRWINEDL